MPIPFSKYHGLGNDFILIEGPPQPLSPEAVRTICDRHFGVGADGILIVSPNPTHDAQMIVLNADGSRPEMCGNGLRCVALHVASRATSHPTSLQLQIATDAGTKTCSLSFDPNCTIADVQIDMGFVSTPQPQTLECHDHTVELFTSSIGNPHATLINPTVDFERFAPALANHSAFPHQTNVGFLTTTADHLRLRVWERGAGPTLACGTAACAAATVAVHYGLASTDQPIPIHLPGGPLTIQLSTDNRAVMTGPAQHVFDGTLLAL